VDIGKLFARVGLLDDGFSSEMNLIKRKSKSFTDDISKAFTELGKTVSQGATAYKAWKLGTKVFGDAFQATEKIKISTVSMAAIITSMSKQADKDLAGAYKKALAYTQQLVPYLEVLDAKTVATAQGLMAMAETFAYSGVLLKTNNKEQEQGFVNIANALALITQGQDQEIQMRQEIRGLMSGQVRDQNRLAVMINNMVGGDLKKHLAIWIKEGTVIENIGGFLKGFAASTADIENTWAAIGTTLETIYQRTLRGAFAPIYRDIINWGREIVKDGFKALDTNVDITEEMKKQEKGAKEIKQHTETWADMLSEGVRKGWIVVKAAARTVWDIVGDIAPLLIICAQVTGLMAKGWGYIVSVLPAAYKETKRIADEATGGLLSRTKKRLQEVIEALKKEDLWEALVAASGARDKGLGAMMEARWEKSLEAMRNKTGLHLAKIKGDILSSNFLDEAAAALVQYEANLAKLKLTPEIPEPPELKKMSKGDEEKSAKARSDAMMEEARKSKEIAEDVYKTRKSYIDAEIDRMRELGVYEIDIMTQTAEAGKDAIFEWYESSKQAIDAEAEARKEKKEEAFDSEKWVAAQMAALDAEREKRVAGNTEKLTGMEVAAGKKR